MVINMINSAIKEPLHITFFDNVKDNTPKTKELSWSKIEKLLTTFVIRATKDGKLFSFAKFNGSRAITNVVEIGAVVFDFDGEESLEIITPKLKELSYKSIVYTSFSHQRVTDHNPSGKDCFRVVIPLALPIPKKVFPALWIYLFDFLGSSADPAPKSVGSIFYLPTRASEDAPFHSEVISGKFLDWQTLPLETSNVKTKKINSKKILPDNEPAQLKSNEPIDLAEGKLDEIVLKANLAQANLHLSKFSRKRCDARDLWLKVLMALSELGEQGKQLAKSWSKTSSKYDEADFDRVWASIKPGDGITLASLPVWAEEDNPPAKKDSNNSEASSEAQHSTTWPEPLALPVKLLSVPHFPIELIPEPFRDYLQDTVERMQVPLEFPAITSIISAAALIGNKVSFRPKRHDDWSIIPNLWGVLIADPGQMKTPVFNEVLKPIRALAAKAHTEYEEALKDWEMKEFERKARRNALKEEAVKVVKNKGGLDQIQYDLEQLNEPPPVEKRFIINDSTTEKIGILLNQNPNGLLLYRDELTGWLASFEKPGRETDRAFFLEAWNGIGEFTFDRVGRGTLHIKNLTLSILGSIQPSPLARYIKATTNGSEGNDGLLQRFQLAVYPDPIAEWNNVDRPPNEEAQKRFFQVFENLNSIDGLSLGAFIDSDGHAYLRFEDEAQEFFDSWRKDLEKQVRINDHPAIIAHLAKYRKLMPAFSLIFHLIDYVDGNYKSKVSLASAQRAAAWCSLLEAHARRIYSLGNIAQTNSASLLANRIQKGEIPTIFRARDIYRHQWPGIANAEETHKAIAVLEDCRWIKGFDYRPNANNPPEIVRELISRGIDLPARGKSVAFFFVNPKLGVKE